MNRYGNGNIHLCYHDWVYLIVYYNKPESMLYLVPGDIRYTLKDDFFNMFELYMAIELSCMTQANMGLK